MATYVRLRPVANGARALNTPSPNRNNVNIGLSERRSAEVSAGWQQLDAGRSAIDRHRANEVAEAEALALARIQANTERSLANQAQALRDAEKAAELVAIERRAADLDVVREMQRRQALDLEAQLAADARCKADRLAVAAANEKTQVFEKAAAARQRRLEAEKDALAARHARRLARVGLTWAAFRGLSPAIVGLIALALGVGVGMLTRGIGRSTPAQVTNVADSSVLKLDAELTSVPLKSAR